jgi:hypothetical protein
MSRFAVFSTHLDDAVLSCYSALGPEATVITVLAGVPPVTVLGCWDAAGSAASSRERVLQRREEDKRALLLTQSNHVHLDFPEGQQWGQAGLAQPTVEELTAKLRLYLSDADFVHAPAGIGNPEHKLIRDAVLAARADATLYADLPYALHPDTGGFALPPEVPSEGRQRRDVHLDPADAAAKVEACRCYETQLAQLIEIYGRFLSPVALGREVFWDYVGEPTRGERPPPVP